MTGENGEKIHDRDVGNGNEGMSTARETDDVDANADLIRGTMKPYKYKLRSTSRILGGLRCSLHHDHYCYTNPSPYDIYSALLLYLHECRIGPDL